VLSPHAGQRGAEGLGSSASQCGQRANPLSLDSRRATHNARIAQTPSGNPIHHKMVADRIKCLVLGKNEKRRAAESTMAPQ
jgi:hypothetical protein